MHKRKNRKKNKRQCLLLIKLGNVSAYQTRGRKRRDASKDIYSQNQMQTQEKKKKDKEAMLLLIIKLENISAPQT
jgi:hypothetical protein